MPGRDKITPQGKDFFKQIEELTKLQVRVGFTANGKGYGDRSQEVTAKEYEKTGDKPPPTIAEVAAFNELGTEHSPPRPFLRQSVDKNKAHISRAVKGQMERLVKGEITAERALQEIGAMQVGLVQREIKGGGFAANAPRTIAKKGSDVPLIDTGSMRQSVHYVIEAKGDD